MPLSCKHKTVTCCGSDQNFNFSEIKYNFNSGLSEVKYNLRRSLVKSKKVTDKLLDRNR